jgi:hypothetical protein
MRAAGCVAPQAHPPALRAFPTTQLGSCELEVSRLGLGTMTFGERNSYEEAAVLLSLAGAFFSSPLLVPFPFLTLLRQSTAA